jgi:ubiquinone/menaquinone biosynthesis C-methylase UbiE
VADYDAFSRCYDQFTEDVDYAFRVSRILQLFEKYDKKPTLLLDLACGTGNFSFPLAQSGMEVIGVDCSDGMLANAISKLPQGVTNPLFLNQYAEELELYGTVDGAICMLDSLNHITKYENFKKAVERVSLFLEKDRLFIFDLNTPYKHKEVLGDNVFVREDETAFCVWQNEYVGENTVDIYLDFFVETENGCYERLMENFSEVAYTKEQIESALENAGLELVASLDDMTDNAPTETSERITYIVRKK